MRCGTADGRPLVLHPSSCSLLFSLLLFFSSSSAATVDLDLSKGQGEIKDGQRTLLTLDNREYHAEDNGFAKADRPAGYGGLQDSLNSIHQPRADADTDAAHAKPKRKDKSRPFPTGDPGPKLSAKKEVTWHEDTHYYALKASSDTRFRVRHAPIPGKGTPWPLPQLYNSEAIVFPVSEDFQFHAIGESCDILEFYFERIRRMIFGEPDGGAEDRSFGRQASSSVVHFLNVTVLKECEEFPTLDMDESCIRDLKYSIVIDMAETFPCNETSYDLEVKKSGASIMAREVWGALRGMETFAQLVYQNDDTGRFYVNKTYIHDYPRFKHRGVHLDTARHFLNKEIIVANLEAMAMNKMNVFHWHIVDDQSFPFQSKTFPNLTKMGSYNPQTHIYTHEDIADIIEEARLRGIRVIPEFDTPGHTLSWGYGMEHLLTPCYDWHRVPDGFFGPINPILKTTYRFLKSFFKEVLTVFKDKYVHLGGDEVPFDCWASNPYLLGFMRRNNLTDIRDLLHLYERELLELISHIGTEREGGTGYIVWQEVFDNGVKVKPDTIIQIWSGDAIDIDRVTSSGLRAIFSTCWYLDYTSYGQDWDKYYRCEQINQHLQDYGVRNQSLLMGGEACLWTEYADNEVLMARLWPRASAAAERLWSDKSVTDPDAAAPRIEEQRCRMIRRGLKVGVLSGPGFCSQPPKSSSLKRSFLSWPKVDTGSSFLMDTGQARHFQRSNVYVVDMSAMYLVPIIIIICFAGLVLLSWMRDQTSQNKLINMLSCPIALHSSKGVIVNWINELLGQIAIFHHLD
ncbi:hypothetical protein CAPTEDRAFT_228468 [Capitella teleta]|uniref:beta-N-acetylhexosaminidase n=1 Tax=Capitella teleta TaxID=283909 RepID=R7UXQ2_CAPTE|nr:hypothetical protein CAPTEDRAFT_228468 [Capitella teleta]|eukprot:ELU11062.1 hypothetical protein CAPTEDRAFT_228468 [Capitella teleta]